MIYIPIAITAVLFLAAISDLKTKEVPDWVHIAIIIISWLSAGINIISSFIGMALGFIIGYALFSMNQWGGADAKLITALGAYYGFTSGFLDFGVNLLFMVPIWAVIYAVGNKMKLEKHTPFIPAFLLAFITTEIIGGITTWL